MTFMNDLEFFNFLHGIAQRLTRTTTQGDGHETSGYDTSEYETGGESDTEAWIVPSHYHDWTLVSGAVVHGS